MPFLPLEFEPYYKMDKDPIKEKAQNPTSMDKQGRDPSNPLYCPPQALLETRDPIVLGWAPKDPFHCPNSRPTDKGQVWWEGPQQPIIFPPLGPSGDPRTNL